MEWDGLIDSFLKHHHDGLPAAIGDLVSRCIIAGLEVDWKTEGGDIRLMAPEWLPTIDDRLGPTFTAFAHGWYCDPFDAPPNDRRGHGRADLQWIQKRNVWLQWPDRNTGWHWLVPIPLGLPICEQLLMAEKLFDALVGDVDVTMNLLEHGGPLGVKMKRRGAETIATVTRGDTDAVTTTLRLRGSMRDCFMTAVAQTSDDQEPVGVTAH